MLAIKNILALQFSTYGNLTYAKQEIKKVALKALYKLRKEMGCLLYTSDAADE